MNSFVKVKLGIRQPIDQVFEAFINPEITTKFWFTHSTARLDEGTKVEWAWQMYNIVVPVVVKEVERNEKIIIEWGEGVKQSTVKWEFKAINEKLTFVTISNYDFQEKGDDLIATIKDSTQGFTFVLAGLKAWLEHSIQLNLVGDVFPKEMME